MGYIYVRSDTSNHDDNICKLGQTENILNRDNQYATGEYIRGKFILIIEILDEKYNHIYTEKILQKEFINYHMKKDGGNEFYKIDIIKLIIPFLEKTIINFRVLTKEEIDNLIKIPNNKIRQILKKLNKITLREIIQNSYLKDILDQLNINKKVFIKAPTGFGKTHIYYKIIKNINFNKILFLTPRLNLNIQITDSKYSYYIENDNYKIIHYSHSTNKENIIKQIYNYDKIILTSCYQSGKKLLELIKKYDIKFDAIIFDEAHFITKWKDNDDIRDFIDNFEISKYKIFGSATPTLDIEENQDIYGHIIEKVKVYNLINNKILCNIETIIKKLEDKKKRIS